MRGDIRRDLERLLDKDNRSDLGAAMLLVEVASTYVGRLRTREAVAPRILTASDSPGPDLDRAAEALNIAYYALIGGGVR